MENFSLKHHPSGHWLGSVTQSMAIHDRPRIYRAEHNETDEQFLACSYLAAMSGRICEEMIHRHLAETGLYVQHPTMCVSLTASNRKDRILWS
ncbi:hypothetical protein TNCV_2860261 [Trichonephila clavipes]|nr:hypothetical protein TNCV_2860261 [Trichonephila clavipes]